MREFVLFAAVFVGIVCLMRLTEIVAIFIGHKFEEWMLNPDNKFMRHYEKDIYFNREYAAPPCSCKKFLIFTLSKKNCRRHNYE